MCFFDCYCSFTFSSWFTVGGLIMFDWIDDFFYSLDDVAPSVDFMGYLMDMVPPDLMTYCYIAIALVLVVGVIWILCQIF